mmetsp:Transcript_80338/g.245568  ORF Transcript_80338/g.245568 Transcript_80338/m.245568 type:complete len:297 (-) Transcript_80338:1158-2048(-)
MQRVVEEDPAQEDNKQHGKRVGNEGRDGRLAALAADRQHLQAVWVQAEEHGHAERQVQEGRACDHAGGGEDALVGLPRNRALPLCAEALSSEAKERPHEDAHAGVWAQIDADREGHGRELEAEPPARYVHRDRRHTDAKADDDGVPRQVLLDQETVDERREHLALRRGERAGAQAEGVRGDVQRHGHNHRPDEQPQDLREEALLRRQTAQLERLVVLAHVVRGAHRDASGHQQGGDRGHGTDVGVLGRQCHSAQDQRRHEDRARNRGRRAADLQREDGAEGHHEQGHDEDGHDHTH